jgi:hypothetical protein
MEVDTARRLLADGAATEQPVFLPPSVLSKLSIDDLLLDTCIEIGVLKDGVMHVEWAGRLYRQGDRIIGEANYTWTRKYWYAPVGLEHYLDLVRRAVELRHKTHRDVKLTHYDDDGAYIQLTYTVLTDEKNLVSTFR